MPLYEYICLDARCGHEFEFFMRPQDIDQPIECPHCLGTKVEKLISAHGGYSMNSGPASVRPKQAGAFRGKRK